MELKLTGNYDEIEVGLRLLTSVKSFVLSNEGQELFIEKNDENKLSVSIENSRGRISYGKKADFFRGFMILLEQLNSGTKSFAKEETRQLNSNGIMLSMGKTVMKTETVKDFIRRMALMGLDSLYLYMEDAYKMEKYPYFGYMRGAYTKDELKEMDTYAQIFGVEIIPTIQTLGHLESTLRWRYTEKIKDVSDSLMVGEAETYAFIEEIFRTMRECFHTTKLHIGMDEAYQMGRGAYLDKHGLKDFYDIFTEHLNRVSELAVQYGFQPMIWSDMYFTLGSESGKQYDPNCVLPENIQETIPKELSMVYWDYFIEDPKLYDRMFARHRELGRNIIFAGAIWTWCNVVVNYSRTFRTSKTALEACYRNQIKDTFMTIWGGALDVDYYQTLLGMQLFAEYTYADQVSKEQIFQMFRVCTGLDPDAYWALDGDDLYGHPAIEKLDPIWKSIQLSQEMLYQDVMYGIFDDNYKELDLERKYRENLERLIALPAQGEMEYIFDFQRKMVAVLLKKCKLSLKLYEAYREKDLQKISELRDVMLVLKEDIMELYDLHVQKWNKDYKAFGMEFLAERYGTLILRMETAAKRLTWYLNGEINCLEELEEKKLRYTNLVVNHEEDIIYEDDFRSIAFI